ncbi:MAG: restriction endonuclease subunit S [Bacteroidetes bacterium]|nr:restriction endonuclease subunit S [Bacteroidota bacterium]
MNDNIAFDLELPKGWIKTSVGEVSDKIHYGYTASADFKNVGPKLLRITDIQRNKVDWDTVPNCKIDKTEIEKFLLSENDLVFARTGATVGKSFLIKSDVPKAVFASYLIRAKLNSSINPKFIYCYFQSSDYWRQISNNKVGIGQPNVNAAILSNLSLPLPPLPEQHRIVAKIEELFTKLDVAVDELKKAKAQIKRYRQSVLKNAFEGKLTEEWRKQTSNVKGETAEELLAKIKEERKKFLGKKYKELPPVDTTNLPQLPEEWVWTQLDCVCKKIQDGTHFSPKVQYKDKLPATYPYVTAKNIKEYGLDLSDITYIEQELHKTIYNRCNPEFGDILLTKDGAKTGVAALNTLDEEFSLLSSVALLKPNKNILFNKFLLFYLKSEIGLQMILGKMTGVAIKRIILEKINNSVIPIACLDEQIIISNEIERHFSVADETEKIIDQSLKQAERLRQSILKDAFSGKLVPQDPSDPPASLLLEKIKAEKEKLAKEPKRKSRTGEPAEKLLERIKAKRAKQTPAKRTKRDVKKK